MDAEKVDYKKSTLTTRNGGTLYNGQYAQLAKFGRSCCQSITTSQSSISTGDFHLIKHSPYFLTSTWWFDRPTRQWQSSVILYVLDAEAGLR